MGNRISWHGCLQRHISSCKAAALHGFAEHDVAVFVATRLLKPLGNLAANTRKCLATEEFLKLARDRLSLGRAAKAVSRHRRQKQQPVGKRLDHSQLKAENVPLYACLLIFLQWRNGDLGAFPIGEIGRAHV